MPVGGDLRGGDGERGPFPDEDVLVRRSGIDLDVWVCVATEVGGGDMSSLLSPGRVRAVKRFAEREFANGYPMGSH